MNATPPPPLEIVICLVGALLAALLYFSGWPLLFFLIRRRFWASRWVSSWGGVCACSLAACLFVAYLLMLCPNYHPYVIHPIEGLTFAVAVIPYIFIIARLIQRGIAKVCGWRRWVVLCLLSGHLASAGAVGTTPTAPARLDAAPDIPSFDAASLRWLPDLRQGLLDAGAHYRLALVLFVSPDCPWCLRFKREVVADPAIAARLRAFTLVELDVTRQGEPARQYGIRGVPSIAVLDGDGSPRTIVEGYTDPAAFTRLLDAVADLKITDPRLEQVRALLAQLDARRLPEERWPDLMQALGVPAARVEARGRLLRVAPDYRAQWVALLSHPRLAVRLGALELLEELSGQDFGYEPWFDAETDTVNASALARWKDWATDTNAAAAQAFTPLSREAVAGYIEDLTAEQSDKVARARRMLAQGDAGTAALLAEFLRAHPALPAGATRRVREARYSMLLPAVRGAEPSALAHRLLFGNPDARMKALRSLADLGRKALPIVEEFLAEPDPLVRETAVDTLVRSGGMAALPILTRHLEQERDRDVLFVLVRALGAIRSARCLKLLGAYASHADEDLAVAALESMRKLESVKAADYVRGALQDARWRVRAAAVQTAGALNLRALADAVEALIRDDDAFVRHNAVQAVARLAADKDKAAVLLEAVFLRDDPLKGAAVAAFAGLDKPFPAGFVEGLKGKDPDLLLEVLGNLKESSERGLPLAAALARHANQDVACDALRLLAQAGADVPRYQAILTDALLHGTREEQLAVLTALRGKRDREDVFAWANGALPVTVGDDTPSASAPLGGAGVAPAGGAADDLMRAFLDEDAKPAPAAGVPDTARTSAPASSATAVAQDVFAAFLGADAQLSNTDGSDVESHISNTLVASATPSTARATTASGGLIAAVRALTAATNSELRFESACALAQLGDTGGLPMVMEGLDTQPESARQRILESLTPIAARAETLPLLGRFLQDPAEELRREAAGLLVTPPRPERVDALFGALLSAGARLRPREVFGYALRSAAGKASGARALRPWVAKLLERAASPDLQNLGLMLLELCWKADDAARLEPFLRSDNPWHRRAAWHALGKKAPDAFRKRLGEVGADATDTVREVIPALYAEGVTWLHYFDATHFDESYDYTFDSENRRLKPEEKEALVRLTTDASAKVRLGAFLALMARREPIDPDALARTVDVFPDPRAAARQMARQLERQYRSLDRRYAVLLPYLNEAEIGATTLAEIRQRLEPEEAGANEEISNLKAQISNAAPTAATSGLDPESVLAAGASARPAGTESEPGETPGASSERPVTLLYFSQTGCDDCERAREWLRQLREQFPDLIVEEHDIRLTDALRLNEALCRRFDVPEARRLVAPAVFAAGGFLIKQDVTPDRLMALIERSETMADDAWRAPAEESLAAADEGIRARFSALTLGVVLAAGLLDGVNPCAFATLIFFLSYLHVTRKSPREIAQVGLAFMGGVFLAYFGLGLGVMEIVAGWTLLPRAGRLFHLLMAVAVAFIMALNVRDGIRCLRGRMRDMTLQLPGALKGAIHAVIRRHARHRHFVWAALATGVAVSVLELACTGQVYAPTLLFVLKTGASGGGALLYLALYNLAFILPLAVVFALAYAGLRSEALGRWLQRHAAAVKFATAGLFLLMFVWLVINL